MRLIGASLRHGTTTGGASFQFAGPETEAIVMVVGPGTVPPELPTPVAWILEAREIPDWLPGGGSPVVGDIDTALIAEGDQLRVDGDHGSVEVEGVAETPVVTAFLQRPDGKVLLLRRSQKVGSFRGLWAAVSGFLEDPTAEQQAFREIDEETGLTRSAVRLARVGHLVKVRSGPRCYVVHPFRFEVDGPTVRLDWEHTEARWVDPEEIGRLPCVPRLLEAWKTVEGSDPTVPTQRLFPSSP